MKSKLIMLITIAIICILLTSVMFVQFKTVRVVERSGISDMRESELRAELTSWRSKTEEAEVTLEENKKLLEEYNKDIENDNSSLELLKSELSKLETSAGYTAVTGKGIEITVEDGEAAVSAEDILLLIYELKYVGAEAISINDERYVTITDIVDVENKFIVVNGQRLVSPYTIKAIGDPSYLESAVNIKGGYKDTMEAEGKVVSYKVKDDIRIEKYNGVMEINYGK